MDQLVSLRKSWGLAGIAIAILTGPLASSQDRAHPSPLPSHLPRSQHPIFITRPESAPVDPQQLLRIQQYLKPRPDEIYIGFEVGQPFSPSEQMHFQTETRNCVERFQNLGELRDVIELAEQCQTLVQDFKNAGSTSQVSAPAAASRSNQIRYETFDHFARFDSRASSPDGPSAVENPAGETLRAAISDVSSVLLYMNKGAELDRDLTAEQRADLGSGLVLLLEAQKSISRMGKPCPGSRFELLTEDDPALSRLFLQTYDARNRTPEQVFLGTQGMLGKANRYRFTHEGQVHYLVQSGDRWIFAQFDRVTGKAILHEYAYVETNALRPLERLKPESDDQSVLLGSFGTLKDPHTRVDTYFELDYGVIVRSTRQDLGSSLWIPLPQKVDLARAHFGSRIGGLPVSSQLSISTETARVDATLASNQSNDFAGTAAMSCSLDGSSWKTYAGVRVLDLNLGYETGADGKQAAFASIREGQTTASLSSDFRSNPTLSLSRYFRKRTGIIQGSTNFRDRAQISLIVLLK